MAKYKVGNKITIRQWEDMAKEYGYSSLGNILVKYAFTKDMKSMCGRTYKINYVNSEGGYRIEGSTALISDGMIEPELETIVIYRKGTDTIGILKKDGKEVKRAVAKLHPNDTYSFTTGSKLTLSRLLEKEPEKETFYNGKVVCLNNDRNEGLYTVGKIYEFKNGFMIDDRGKNRPLAPVHNFAEFNEWTGSDWLEIKE